jgi:hypothetical protein
LAVSDRTVEIYHARANGARAAVDRDGGLKDLRRPVWSREHGQGVSVNVDLAGHRHYTAEPKAIRGAQASRSGAFLSESGGSVASTAAAS